jgi:NADPH-dependent curcumin reductase CurA
MRDTQQRVVLARIPVGVPVPEDFQLVEAEVRQPGPGEFLARAVYLSLDPYVRSAIAGRHLGHGSSATGDLVPGRSVCRIVASRHPAYPEGAWVLMETGWQQYAVSDGRDVRRLDPSLGPLSASLGVLGMPGLTAWAGVMTIARARAGETLLVSAASGAVGSTAGQLARLAGCRTVGLAGSAEKCAVVREKFRFDACVDYKQEHWREELSHATGRHVDVYFDNAGPPLLDAALDVLALRGRVVLCGLIGQYNTGIPNTVALAPLIRKRAQVFGLVVYDHEATFEDYLRRASRWLAEGQIAYHEDRSDSLASAPAAFHRLMSGRNVGKSIVVVSAEDEEG